MLWGHKLAQNIPLGDAILCPARRCEDWTSLVAGAEAPVVSSWREQIWEKHWLRDGAGGWWGALCSATHGGCNPGESSLARKKACEQVGSTALLSGLLLISAGFLFVLLRKGGSRTKWLCGLLQG